MRARYVAILITLFLAAISVPAVLWLVPERGAKSGSLLKPDDMAIVAEGRTIYLEQCASCHGAELQGQPDWKSPGSDGLMPAPPHDESGHTWHHPDDVLFNITKLGVVKAAGLTNYESAMPAYEEQLSDGEIIAVLSFIKSTWPERIRNGHDQMNERYAKEPKS